MNTKKGAILRRAIDFRPDRGNSTAQVLYTVLTKVKGSRFSEMSASKLVVDAFNAFDDTVPEQVTAITDQINKATEFMKRFEVRTEDDIYKARWNRIPTARGRVYRNAGRSSSCGVRGRTV